MTRPIAILGVAGSLRAGSIHRSLIAATAALAPEGVTVSPYDLRGIPLYDGDLDGPEKPAAVRAFTEAIAAADGVLFATPEYNHSVPGVLKNAIDWASRPAFRSPLLNKPVAVFGASPGSGGAAIAQEHLRTILLSTRSPVFHGAQLAIGQARARIIDGEVVDEGTRERLAALVAGFADFARRLTD